MIGWIATALSFAGIILNGKKNIWCWPVWLLSNVFWVTLGFKYHDGSMVACQVGFVALNVYGWRAWLKGAR